MKNRIDRQNSVMTANKFRLNLIILFTLCGVLSAFSYTFAKDKDSEKDAKDCLTCHPEYLNKLSGKFQHHPFEKEKCLECHEFHGFRNRIEFRSDVVLICTNCHDIIEDMPEEAIHAPLLEDESCTLCHDPHSSDSSKALLKSKPEELCLECHDGPEDDAAGLHQPFKEKKCTKCHNPHGSMFPSFLNLPTSYICLECHSDIVTGFSPDQLHSANDINSCEQCHEGHGSGHSSILKKEPTKLCLSCHKDVKELVTTKKQHTVLDDETCTVCHNPHHQKSEINLVDPTPDLCFNCHSDIEEKEEVEYPHAAMDEGCPTCHDPHAGMLIDSEQELCASCHDIEDQEFLTSHKIGWTPKTCSSCHDPHGSMSEFMLKENLHPPYEEEDCESCHDGADSLIDLQDNDLCLGCHDQPEPDGAHSELNSTNSVCVSCHSPHTSNKHSLLKLLFNNE